MSKIYGIPGFVNDKHTAIQRTVEILPKTGTQIIKFTNNEKLMSKVVIPGSGNSFASRRMEKTITNYENNKPKSITINWEKGYGYLYYMISKNLKNGWLLGKLKP